MKAPVGLLSDRTVLRSKMEGPRPDKFHFYAKESRLCKPCAEKPLIRANVQTVCRKCAAVFLHKKERQIFRFDVQYLVHLQGLEP